MRKKILAVLLCVLSLCSLCVPAWADDSDIVAKFNGKTIAVQSGTIFVTLIDEILDDYQVLYFDGLTDCVAAVKQGKADAALADEPCLRYCAAQVGGLACVAYGEPTDQFASIAPKTEEGQLHIDQFNEFYRGLVASGERDVLTEKWLNGSVEEQTMEDYTDYPATNGTLVIAVDPTFPPLQFIREEMIVGYETELWAMFCKEYGYKPQFENVTFGGIIAGVTSGKYDIGAAGFSITEERKESVLFTDTILMSGTGFAYAEEDSKTGLMQGINSTFIEDNRWKSFLSGMLITTKITVFSILFGTALGFGLYMLCRMRKPWLSLVIEGLRRLIVGMPVVVWLMVLYYIIFGKTEFSSEWVAIIGFSVLFGFSVCSMLASGERSVDPGQSLAADVMGYSKSKAFFRIVLPQAIQFILPSFQDETISHLKATAVVGYIAVVDVTKVGDLVRGMTYDAFFPLIAVALVYFLLSAILRLIISSIRRGTNPRLRSKKTILKGAVLK